MIGAKHLHWISEEHNLLDQYNSQDRSRGTDLLLEHEHFNKNKRLVSELMHEFP